MQAYSGIELSYRVADVLAANGLRLPVSGGIPRVEIKSLTTGGRRIKVGGKAQIGDLDVLAGDQERNEILICECKMYRAGITPKEFVRIDLDRVADAVEKVRRRHQWARDNAAVLGTFLGLKPDCPSVRSLIVTARPSFMAARFDDPDMEFLDFAALIKRYPATHS